MKCNHCGAEIASDSVFCEHCGKKIGEEPKASEDKKDKKMNPKTIGFIAGGVVVVALLAILLWPKSTTELYPVLDEFGNVGFMDKSGNIVINPQFNMDGTFEFKDGLARVRIYDKYGYIDASGKMVIPAQYDYAFDFSEGLALVELGNQRYFIDKDGNTVIPLQQYENVSPFSDGLAIVYANDKYGFIDKEGNLVIPIQYATAGEFHEGRAIVGNDSYDRYGFIDKEGKLVIPMQYEGISDFHEGLAAVSTNDLYGYIDKDGKLVISYRFENARDFNGDWAAVREDGKSWGFIDKEGNYLVNPKYNKKIKERHYSKDMAIVRMNNQSLSIIDKSGKVIFSLSGENVEGRMYNDLALVGKEDNDYSYYYYVNKSGDVVYEFKLPKAKPSEEIADSTYYSMDTMAIEEAVAY